MEKIEKRLLQNLKRTLGKDVAVRAEALGPQKTPRFVRIGKPQVAVPKNQPLPQLLPPPPPQEMMLPPPILGAGGVPVAPPTPAPYQDPMMAAQGAPVAPQPQTGPVQEEPVNPFDLYNQGGNW